MTLFAKGKTFRLVLILFAIIGSALGYSRIVVAYPDYWSDTLGGVFLEGETNGGVGAQLWGNGSSDASQSINNVSVWNYGRENCDGNIYYRWSDSETNQTRDADANGAAYYATCQFYHCYYVYSDHFFQKNGAFTAAPSTDELDENWYNCS